MTREQLITSFEHQTLKRVDIITTKDNKSYKKYIYTKGYIVRDNIGELSLVFDSHTMFITKENFREVADSFGINLKRQNYITMCTIPLSPFAQIDGLTFFVPSSDDLIAYANSGYSVAYLTNNFTHMYGCIQLPVEFY